MSKIIEFGVVFIGLAMTITVIVLGIIKKTTVEINIALLSVSLLLVALAVLMQTKNQSR